MCWIKYLNGVPPKKKKKKKYIYIYIYVYVYSGGWWIFLRWGCTQFHKKIIHNKSNHQADLDPAPLPSVFLPKFSSQTDIGVEIVQS